MIFEYRRFKWLLLLIIFAFCACDGHLSEEPPLHRAAYNGDVGEIK